MLHYQLFTIRLWLLSQARAQETLILVNISKQERLPGNGKRFFFTGLMHNKSFNLVL